MSDDALDLSPAMWLPTETQQLDQLFSEWIVHYADCQEAFVMDGIIEQGAWTGLARANKKKVLFLLKEPNLNLKKPNHDERDVRIWHTKKRWLLLDEISYGLMNSTENKFPPYHHAKKQSQKLRASFAWVNLKKLGGGGSVENGGEQIQEAVQRDWDTFIQKELDIIQPDIVVCGGTWALIKNRILPYDKQTSRCKQVTRNRHSEVWIDCIHPSAHCADEIKYYALMAIYQTFLKECEDAGNA